MSVCSAKIAVCNISVFSSNTEKEFIINACSKKPAVINKITKKQLKYLVSF